MNIFFIQKNIKYLKITLQLFLFLGYSTISLGQLKIGMSPKAIIPSTVTANSSYSVVVWIKNKGTIPYTGKIHINYGVDSTQTLTNIILTKLDSISVTNFMPGDSVLKSFGETYNIPNAYRVHGNGSTVILWPFVKSNSTVTNDSLKRIVYVLSAPVSIDEITYLETQIMFPNPTTDLIYFKENENFKKPQHVIIKALLGDYKREMPYHNPISTIDLPSGIYFIELLDNSGIKHSQTFIIQN